MAAQNRLDLAQARPGHSTVPANSIQTAERYEWNVVIIISPQIWPDFHILIHPFADSTFIGQLRAAVCAGSGQRYHGVHLPGQRSPHTRGHCGSAGAGWVILKIPLFFLIKSSACNHFGFTFHLYHLQSLFRIHISLVGIWHILIIIIIFVSLSHALYLLACLALPSVNEMSETLLIYPVSFHFADFIFRYVCVYEVLYLSHIISTWHFCFFLVVVFLFSLFCFVSFAHSLFLSWFPFAFHW